MELPRENFFNKEVRKNKECPNCGSREISFLMYGIADDDDLPLVQSGEVILLGCILGKVNLGCRKCEHTWMSVELT